MERENNHKNPAGNKIAGVKKWKRAGTYSTNYGYVLIFSLWAIVIFGFVALSFTRNTGIAIKTEIAFTERIKNIYVARGACIYATQMMLVPQKQVREKKSGKIKRLRGDKRRKRRGPWLPSNEPYSIEIGGRSCDVLITDEGGKVNINKLTDDTRLGFIKFLKSYNLEELTAETITDCILDWLDKDDLHHINGAEKDYYVTLPEPYEPKNGPFDSIEELTLVKGVTPQIFELLRNHITIYGSGKINIKFASKEVLMSIPGITPEIAEAITILKKKGKDIKQFTVLKEIFKHFGIIGSDFQNITKYLTLSDSGYMTVNAVASTDTMKNSYKVIVKKGVGSCKIVAAYPE